MMRINKIFIILFFVNTILFFGNTVFAEDVKKASIEKFDINFGTAYELMITNNNSIKAMLEDINVRKYEKKAAIGEFFPKVGLNTTATHFNDSINVETPPVHSGGVTIPIAPITLQERNLWFAGVGAYWNIFTGGKILALNSAARAKLEGSNQKFRLLTNDLTIELIKRYYGLKLAQDIINVRKQVLDATQKHLSDAKKLEKEGIIPKSERLHADVAYRQAQKDYQIALRDYDIIEEGLKTLIKAEDINLKNVKVVPTSGLFIYEKDIPKLEDLKQEALKSNPNLKQMDVKKKLAQADYRSKAASYAPTVSLFMYDIFANDNLSRQVPSLAVGATANWTVFDGFSRYNKLKAADCTRKQVKYETLNAQNNIESLVVKNYNEFLKYKEEYESTNQSIESATEALRTSSLAFKEGIGTSLAVIDAETALSGIKIQRLNAIYNYDIKLAEILSTNGKAEDILEYIKNSKEEKL